MTNDQFQHLLAAIDRVHARVDEVRAELRGDLREARQEASADHAAVKERLDTVEHNQAAMLAKAAAADARADVVAASAEDRARHRSATIALAATIAAVISTVGALLWGVVDHV